MFSQKLYFASIMNIWSSIFSTEIEDDLILQCNEKLARTWEEYKILDYEVWIKQKVEFI
jgi:hypothetical protein